MFSRLTKGDKVLIIVVVLSSLLALFVIKNTYEKTGKYVEIETAAGIKKKYVLGPDLAGEIIQVEGVKGHTLIELGKNKVRVISSACERKDCIKMGWIQNPGEIIVCLPNQVIVRIKGAGEKPQLDGGTY